MIFGNIIVNLYLSNSHYLNKLFLGNQEIYYIAFFPRGGQIATWLLTRFCMYDSRVNVVCVAERYLYLFINSQLHKSISPLMEKVFV